MMQFNVIRKVFKENLIWILIFLLILLTEYFLYLVDNVTTIKMISTFIVGPGNSLTPIIAYKNILLIIILYRFYIYEINNNYIYIFNRCKVSKWFNSKLLWLSIIILLYNFLYYLTIFVMYHNAFSITLKLLLNIFAFDILITFIMITIINISCLKKYAPFIAGISIIIIFEHFKIISVVIITTFLIIFNYIFVLKTNALKNINE